MMDASGPSRKPSNAEVAALRAFMSWGAKQSGFPYGALSYWISTYERGDGKDMFDRPTTRPG